jgi:3-deoxy-D-manno-octulosonic-acid transferase
MAGSVGLAAYRAFSRRSGKRDIDTSAPRPTGQLAWMHAADPATHLAVEDLAARLCGLRYGLTVLVTFPDVATVELARLAPLSSPNLIFAEIPSEHPDAVTGFLDHWRPDHCLWIWGGLRPNLVLETAARRCPMALVDVDLAGFDGPRDRWLPDLSRQMLACFSTFVVRVPAAARRLETLGVAAEDIRLSPALQPGGYALKCRDEDLKDLREQLRGRPVWLATGIQEHEIDTLLDAHRIAARLSHRLLLVVHPADPDLTRAFLDKMEIAGYRVANWSAGEDPEDTVQVLLADDAQDLGLFYRVAPVSFLGSSLTPGFGGRNPFEAAALGSAVLYGPNVRRFLPFYSRLAGAGAARIIKDAESLGVAVTRLIAPDQAAGMACAGWDVISEGAATADLLISLVENALDGEEPVRNARA